MFIPCHRDVYKLHSLNKDNCQDSRSVSIKLFCLPLSNKNKIILKYAQIIQLGKL